MVPIIDLSKQLIQSFDLNPSIYLLTSSEIIIIIQMNCTNIILTFLYFLLSYFILKTHLNLQIKQSKNV